MSWLLTAVLALAVIVYGARTVRARGEWPHDPRYDEPGEP